MYKIGRLRMCAMFFLALLLQLTIAPYLSISGVKPDLIIMYVILLGIFLGPEVGLEAGFLGGFIQDIFAADFFWMNTFLGAATGFLSGIISSQFSRDSRLVCAFLVAVLTGVSMSLHYMATILISPYHALGFMEYFFNSVIPGSLTTGLISALVLFYYPEFLALKIETDIL